MLSKIVINNISVNKTQEFSLISVLVIYMYALEVNACIPGSMR